MATEKMSMETELEHLKKCKAKLNQIKKDLTDMSDWFEKKDKHMMSSIVQVVIDLGDAIGEVSNAGWEVEDAINELMEEIKDLEEDKRKGASNGSDD